MEQLGLAPMGVTRWFREGALRRQLLPGLDARMDGRFRRDPPEFVTILSGESDGLHFGLWYDECHRLPQQLAYNWARDDGVTHLSPEPTLIQLIRQRIATYPEDVGEPAGPELEALDEAARAFSEADAEAWSEVGFSPVIRGPDGLAGPGGVPSCPHRPDREDLYRALARGDLGVEEWRKQALAGQPELALALGRDLHWYDGPYREIARELLVYAYRQLNREPLAEIVEVHHRFRDLAQVQAWA